MEEVRNVVGVAMGASLAMNGLLAGSLSAPRKVATEGCMFFWVSRGPSPRPC